MKNLYPNPLRSGELLHVDLGLNNEKFDKIGVWSVNGTLLFTENTGEQITMLNFEKHNVDSGVYYIRAEKNGCYSVPQKLVYLK